MMELSPPIVRNELEIHDSGSGQHLQEPAGVINLQSAAAAAKSFHAALPLTCSALLYLIHLEMDSIKARVKGPALVLMFSPYSTSSGSVCVFIYTCFRPELHLIFTCCFVRLRSDCFLNMT